MIPTAAYYIMDRKGRQAQIYDRNNNFLQNVPLLNNEHYFSSSERIGALLDPAFVSLVRPTKIVYRFSPRLGRTVYFYDRHDNCIKYQPYNEGSINLKEFLRDYPRYPYSFQFDFAWMLDNNIPIEDRCKTKESSCSLM